MKIISPTSNILPTAEILKTTQHSFCVEETNQTPPPPLPTTTDNTDSPKYIGRVGLTSNHRGRCCRFGHGLCVGLREQADRTVDLPLVPLLHARFTGDVPYLRTHSRLSCTLFISRPDMTFAVDWALSNNYLSIYPSLSAATALCT